MRIIKNVTIAAALLVTVMSCKSNTEPEVVTKELKTEVTTAQTKLDPNAKYAKVEFNIEGMTCAMGCAKTIEKKMAKLEGVKMAKVDFDKELAMVEFDEAKVTPSSLKETIAKVSDVYKVKDLKTVDKFSSDKKACKKNCKKSCSKDKLKTSNKMECAKDCKKACCKADKA